MEQPLLSVKEVYGGYGAGDVLHGLSLAVNRDEIVSIVGPNGAGKTTLARVIFGLLRPRAGRVIFRGEEITGLAPFQIARRGMAYSPQENSIFRQLTVRENLALGAYLREDDYQRRLEEIFALFPRLKERLGQTASTMSGGERQMLALARALMMEPDVLLVDEPSLGLQPNLVSEMLDKIVEINEQDRVTIVMIEQAAPKAIEISNRIYVMAMGEVKFSGRPEELRDEQEIGEMYLRG